MLASATDYYVSNAGNDLALGISASTSWKTITKVNSAFITMKPGDRILFNRGGTFYGTIIPTKSGSDGNPITIGSYGTGLNPVITGFTTISGWVNEGNGIYSKVLTSEAQTNMVIIDGVNTGMGRYPKSSYMIYESCSTNASITDNELGNTTNWTGAEAIIRKNDWTLDRCSITNHSGNILTYVSLGTTQNATANYGYFIQNDLRCVTNVGDWYHNKNTGKFYMYFGSINPTTKNVKVATINNLITNQSGIDYITLNNISLSGSIGNAVNYTWQNDHCVIQGCNISFAGQDGVRLFGDFGIIDNNQIAYCNGFGIYSYGMNALITNNALSNISTIAGQSKGWLEFVGIFVEKNDCIIRYNRIENVGYDGISLGAAANNVTIQNNLIINSCLMLNDGAAIYLSGTHSSIKIDGNIILNSIGNNAGTPNKTLMAEGIYLDENANHISVTNNTVGNCSNSGIKLHKAHDNTVLNNISFNNYTGIDFENWTGTSTIYNNTITGNIFFAKATMQFSLRFSSVTNDIPSFGTASNNYYLRPLDDNKVIYTNQTSIGPKNRTLSDWQLFTNQDASSHKSPIALSNTNDIRFEYNELKTNKIVTLDKPMIDAKGAKFVSSITLLPFTSIVLMVDPNPIQATPAYTGSIIENVSPSLVEMTYNLSLASIVPSPSAFIVQVNGINRNINSVVISGNKVLLTLASKVLFNEKVTVTYIKPGTNWIQTSAGGSASSISSQIVTNNCIESSKSNNLPVLVIKNELNYYSGFVGEIDASGSYDLDNDSLIFEWKVPENVTVSSASNSIIQFFSPMVDSETKLEFQIKVTDGIDIVTRSIYINILPYIQELTEVPGNDEIEFLIYPNPARIFINISKRRITQTPQIVKIIDFYGRIVYTCPIEPGLSDLHIPLALTPGIYIIALLSGNSTLFSQKLIINK